MKAATKLFLVLTVLVISGGCATSGLKFTELAPTISNMAPDAGRIYIYRPSSFGAAVRPDVKLNGEVIGEAVSWGFFYVDRKPGNYEILTSTEVDRKLSLTLNKGQSRYVRLSIAMGFFVGHVYPELVENEVGEKEIQDCRYTGQTKLSSRGDR